MRGARARSPEPAGNSGKFNLQLQERGRGREISFECSLDLIFGNFIIPAIFMLSDFKVLCAFELIT